MKKFFITEKCVGCAACKSDCEVFAIENKKIPLTINQKKCIGCGNCFEICPVGAVKIFQKSETTSK